jgi:hypothetical protein
MAGAYVRSSFAVKAKPSREKTLESGDSAIIAAKNRALFCVDLSKGLRGRDEFS